MLWPFGKKKRDEDLLCALQGIQGELRNIRFHVSHPRIPEFPDYSRELRQIASVSLDVQGAAELVSRWVALQLPPVARADVPIPKEWEELNV